MKNVNSQDRIAGFFVPHTASIQIALHGKASKKAVACDAENAFDSCSSTASGRFPAVAAICWQTIYQGQWVKAWLKIRRKHLVKRYLHSHANPCKHCCKLEVRLSERACKLQTAGIYYVHIILYIYKKALKASLSHTNSSSHGQMRCLCIYIYDVYNIYIW